MKTVFFVDAEPKHAETLFKQASDDCNLNTFTSARDCIKSLSERSSQNMDMPDVIIIDYDLPGLNGLQLFEKLSPILEDTKFILMVPKENDQVLLEMIQLGLMNYVMKDGNFTKILKTAIGKEIAMATL